MTRTAAPTRRELVVEVRDVVRDLPRFLTAPLYRRWHRHWGATPAEVSEPLPGDAFVPQAQFRATRAITIDAPAGAVWPWLVQVGCRRAGWYSNDLLDNLARPSATTIVPALQHLEIGQWVPMSPTPTERTALKVHSFEVDKWLLWTKPGTTWAWRLLMEFGDFAMMRRMLRGIKARAEAQIRGLLGPSGVASVASLGSEGEGKP